MRHLDGIYTQKFNRVHHRDDAEEYFLSVVRYIHKNPLGAGVISNIDRYRWSSHGGYLNKNHCPDWLDTRSVMSRCGGLQQYQRFMHEEIEDEIEEFYQGPYHKPVLGSKKFIGRVKERLGDKARVEEEKPESRRLFSPGLGEIVEAAARGYVTAVEQLKRRRRGRENEARMVAIYLARQLGGHKHEEIGEMVGLAKTSSVSSAYLLMKERVAKEKELHRRVRRIEEALINSKKRT